MDSVTLCEICSKREWLLQVRMLVWNWTLAHVTIETFAQSKPIYFSMLIRALKFEKIMGQKEIKGHLEYIKMCD